MLSKVDAVDISVAKSLAREFAIFGSVAISDGRVFLQTATGIFCIGRSDVPAAADPIPVAAKEAPVDLAHAPQPAVIQVRPADVALRAGQKTNFTAWAFDALGRPLGQVKANWSSGQVSIPAAPGAASAAVTLAGNLQGAVDPDGNFTAVASGPHQAGAIVASVNGVSGLARVRVFPPLPWRLDFASMPAGKPPLTWLGAGGKFAVEDSPDGRSLVKLNDLDLYYRARTNFGTLDMSNYTLQADVKVGQKVIAGEKQMPDPGLINSRYVLVLLGNHQRLQIHCWPPTLPYSLNSTIDFPWQADTWYTMKLRVEQGADRAVVSGKVWPRGQAEPSAWTISLQDTMPNRNGNPGLFAHSLVGAAKSLINYDNILVSDNQ